MKPLTLHPHEIRRLLSTGSVTVWRPIKPQPKWDTFGGYEAWRWKCKGGHAHVWDEGREPDEVAFVNQCAPHPPGSERWVRETWAKSQKSDIRQVCYAADGRWGSISADHQIYFHGWTTGVTDKSLSDWKNREGHWVGRGYFGPWRSPATMPRWASRLSVTVASVQARQVESITKDETEAAGMRHGGPMLNYLDFSIWWQSRYGTWNPNKWAWATTLERKEG